MSLWHTFDITSLSAELQAVYSGYEAMTHSAFKYYSSECHKLSFHFLDDRQLNAQAREIDQQWQIGINIAVPVLLQFSFNVLLRSPLLFPQIGELEDDEDYGEFANGIPLTLPPDIEMNELIYSLIGVSRPQNEQRTITAFKLSSIAMSFVGYHELAHLVLGHIKAIPSCFPHQQPSHQLLELIDIDTDTDTDTDDKPVFDNELRQIWEFEADMLATMMVTADMLSPENKAFVLEGLGKSPTDQLSTSEAISFTLTAIGGLFLLENQQISHQHHRTHPAPAIRFWAVASEIVNHMQQHYPQMIGPVDDFHQLVDQTLEDIINAWETLKLSGAALTEYQTPEVALKAVALLDDTRKLRCHAYKDYALKYPMSV